METKKYIFSLDYGNRMEEKEFIKAVLREFDSNTLVGCGIFVNNNPYCLELLFFASLEKDTDRFEDFMKKHGDKTIYLSSTHTDRLYSDVSYNEGDFIMFGRESSGVPEEVHKNHIEIRVPMINTTTRSLNLSNTVAIVTYEALKGIGFPNMK